MEGNVNNEAVEFDSLDMSSFMAFDETPELEESGNPTTGGQEEIIETGEPGEQVESVASKKDQDGEEGGVKPQGSPNPYSSFASALQADGLLSSLDLEKQKIETVEDLITAVKEEIKSNEFKDLNDDQKQFLIAMREGVKPELFKEAKSVETQLMQIRPDDLAESAELREAVLVQDFIDEGASEERAIQFAKLLIAQGKDSEEAEKALTNVQARAKQRVEATIEEARKANQDKQKTIETFKKNVEESIKKSTSIIDGIVLNENVKKEVLDSILKPVATLENGTPVNKLTQDRLKDPASFDIKLHYVYHITKGFTDFSKLKNTAKSQAINELDALIKGNTFVAGQDQNNLSNILNEGSDFDFDVNAAEFL